MDVVALLNHDDVQACILADKLQGGEDARRTRADDDDVSNRLTSS
jgi:hypothetical protein